MSNVLTKKLTESGKTLTEPPAHLTCSVCNPEKFIGMKAVCGTELLGIEAPDEAPQCDTCTEIWPEHLVDEHGYPREWLP